MLSCNAVYHDDMFKVVETNGVGGGGGEFQFYKNRCGSSTVLQLMVLTFKYAWEILEYDHGFKKATEQCCAVMLFIMMFKVVQTNGVGGGGGRVALL